MADLRQKRFLSLEEIALFLLSVASIAFELNVMRAFSVGNWSNFGEMVISIALLGNGIAGTLIAFLQKRVRSNPKKWLQNTALTILPVMALSYILAQKVPFNPVWIISQKIQMLWIALYYFLYALPFFCVALFMGVIFTVLTDKARKLYFWNMAGSGLGGFILLGLMFLLPTRYLVIPIAVLAAGGAWLIQLEKDNGKTVVPLKRSLITGGLLLVSVLSLLLFGNIRIAEYKGTADARVTFADLEEKHYSYSPLGEMEVFQSEQFHFAPGLSDNAVFYLSEMPIKAFWALYINGDGPIGIMREMKEEERMYMDFLPMAAPYVIRENPDVLLIGLGGGFGTFTALHNEAESITVVESNPQLVKLMRDTETVADFNGHVLENEKVSVIENEPRAFVRKRRNRDQFDIVEISLIDSVGMSNSVGNAIHENYTYTVEAFEDYFRALNEDGILSVTTWDNLSPPRNVPRMLATSIRALQEIGVEDPSQHIFAFNLIYSTATVLIKKTPFTQEEIDALNYFCYRMSFEPVYYPGIEERDDSEFKRMLISYWMKFGIPTPLAVPNQEADLFPRRPGDLYHFTVKWALEGKADLLYKYYLFDIEPTTDDRPYFTAFLKAPTMLVFMDELSGISEEWGYILLWITLIQAVIFGLLIILIPIIAGRKKVIGDKKGVGGIILYYSCLGIGYMFIEIVLIQKLVYFLGDPVFSISLVITSMLILSGLGSLFSGRFGEKSPKFIRIAAGVTASTALLYILLLPSILNGLLGWPLLIKMLLTVVIIAPAAFTMGMFFPTGLTTLSKKKPSLVPWAWGVNGALSVTGSILPKILSIEYGFSTVLLIAAILYAVAGLVYPVHLKLKNEQA